MPHTPIAPRPPAPPAPLPPASRSDGISPWPDLPAGQSAPRAIRAGFITRDGKQPFIDTGWLREQAAGLNDRQKRLLDTLYSRFRDQAQAVTEDGNGSLHLSFHSCSDLHRAPGSGAGSPIYASIHPDSCVAVLDVDRANSAEVIRISIARPSDLAILVLDKPRHSISRLQEPPSARQYATALRAHPARGEAQSGETGMPAAPIVLSPYERNIICSYRSGKRTLAKLHELSPALMSKEFSRRQLLIVAMSSPGGTALGSMLSEFESLTGRGFTHEEIVGVAAKGGGPALETLTSAIYDELQCKGFTRREILNMAARLGGAEAMKTALHVYDALTRKNVPHSAIAKIAAKHGGAGMLHALDSAYQWFLNKGFKQEQILAIAGTRGSISLLGHFKRQINTLLLAGFSHAHLTAMASIPNPVALVSAVVRHLHWLVEQGFSPAQIAAFACHNKGVQIIEMVRRNLASFMDKGLSKEQIAGIGARMDAVDALTLIQLPDWQGKLDPEDLCRLLSLPSAPRWALAKFIGLLEQGKEKQEIWRMLDNPQLATPAEAVAGPSGTVSGRRLDGGSGR